MTDLAIALGINFGPRQLTAAYVTAQGDQVILANVTGDDEYQALVANSIANEGVKILRQGQWYMRDGELLIPIPPPGRRESNPQAQTIIIAALETLKDEVNKILEKPIDITSVSVPHHFNESLYVAVVDVLEQEQGIIRPWQIRRYYGAVRLAYHLSSCEGFGLNSSNCDIEDDTHLIFYIDYNDAYLELFMAEVTYFILGEVAKKRFDHLGSKNLPTTAKDAETYWDEVRSELRDFVNTQFIVYEGYEIIRDLRAIVFGGEAPSYAFQSIRNIITDLLPNQVDKIRDTIDPLYVGAFGAAEWAKRQVEDPRILKDIETVTLFPPSHDEL
ncbi:hypothetical protein F4779DRAFT_642234 [Xylariaceae sp. FL0662B]|nr:hypothetical protein F4779DRAFT_642234 [Xylariaceae sp. FL0662B]